MHGEKMLFVCDICGREDLVPIEKSHRGWTHELPVMVVGDKTGDRGIEWETLDLCPECRKRLVVIRRVDEEREVQVTSGSWFDTGYETVRSKYEWVDDE